MGKRILVVDDEPDILKVVVFRLRKAGYGIVQVSNGQEALDVVRRGKKIDLILLDLVMPVMDGYEFCETVKGDAALKDIPILILSASSSHDISEKTRLLGVNGYVVKPFEPEALLGKIKEILG